MIPLKEEPTVNAALCFSDDDAETLASCQSHIALAGNVIVASARHENLLAHYTRTLLAGLNEFAERSVAIRRMPKSSDGLLERPGCCRCHCNCNWNSYLHLHVSKK